MLDIENQILESGYENIACIDEVGRGCLAGDVLACAIIMPKDLRIEGVMDSKKISERKREVLYDEILSQAIGYGIGRVSSDVIDDINIKASTRLAMKKAVENIKSKEGKQIRADYLLIDAESVDLDIPQTSIVKGDDKSHGIACASIIAKVFRDRLCLDWDKKYPAYNLKQHKGYGTKEHRENIKKVGPSPIHRITFLKNILK